ncbi:hypothetical protein [Bacillus sp. CGMCC 1.16541]|uniref:hypothetical protein n=1 Tax=Bacillus sp. CGMCC 1.16541 TaxID=2185143 RepID=UPI000D73DD6C|nr:hypothetical protein [Bacillus sp. CGMCC 1.16541]
MKKIINWLIEPYVIVRSEFQLFAQLKNQQSTPKEERMRIYQLQAFNIMLLLVYSLFFISFFVYIGMIVVVEWYALSGVLVGLLMMSVIKFLQKHRYLKRRNAFIKNDPTLIES